jgi:hypothetical protein
LLSTVPHGREAVSAVAFLSAPHSPDHHAILTAVQFLFFWFVLVLCLLVVLYKRLVEKWAPSHLADR